MTGRISLDPEERALLEEVLEREMAGLDICRRGLQSREITRELFRREMIIKRLLHYLQPADLDDANHFRIGGYC